MKRADNILRLRPTLKSVPPKPAGQSPAKNAQDAKDPGGQQEQNRQNLGVEDDHRTEDMKKGKRGTFP